MNTLQLDELLISERLNFKFFELQLTDFIKVLNFKTPLLVIFKIRQYPFKTVKLF